MYKQAATSIIIHQYEPERLQPLVSMFKNIFSFYFTKRIFLLDYVSNEIHAGLLNSGTHRIWPNRRPDCSCRINYFHVSLAGNISMETFMFVSENWRLEDFLGDSRTWRCSFTSRGDGYCISALGYENFMLSNWTVRSSKGSVESTSITSYTLVANICKGRIRRILSGFSYNTFCTINSNL